MTGFETQEQNESVSLFAGDHPRQERKRTIAASAADLKPGTVLGMITASSELPPVDSGAGDGSQDPYAVPERCTRCDFSQAGARLGALRTPCIVPPGASTPGAGTVSVSVLPRPGGPGHARGANGAALILRGRPTVPVVTRDRNTRPRHRASTRTREIWLDVAGRAHLWRPASASPTVRILTGQPDARAKVRTR